MKNWVKNIKRDFEWISAFNSPFKSPKLKWYFGEIAIGTPYFYPRRWINNPEKPGYKMAVTKKIGFDFVNLGWKTKWSDTDYQFEWNPIWSFVFFKWQIAVSFVPHDCHYYWEAWLYYHYNTKGTQRERIEVCKKEFPQTYAVSKGETVNFYNKILKRKYS